MNAKQKVAVIGGGFAGLAAAHELVQQGIEPIVFEGDPSLGGLAGSFLVKGHNLEKFYHHWFNNDLHVMEMIKELGAEDNILLRSSNTGMYFAKSFFKLSSPLDVLRFTPLSFINRIRLGLLVLKARKVKHWEPLEGLTAEEWLISLCGRKVYEVVWEPLLRGKFGPYAKEISAVWFWNKLKLRGGSRGKKGAEQLAYFQGGFAHLAELMATGIVKAGGSIHVSTPVESLIVENGEAVGVKAGGKEYYTDAVLATPALPIIAKMVAPHTTRQYVKSLEKIEYLANICLVLELDRSLSKIYWLNVNDVNFPFVGIIEHTNFEPPESYSGRHIVYLSKYLPADHEMYRMTPEQVLEVSIPHIQRMFPEFRREWIQDFHLWKARYSQPIVVKHYSKLIPDYKTPIPGLFISSMAQVYPEDRGTNYAIRDGRKVGKIVADELKASVPKIAANGILSPSGNSRHTADK